MALATKAKYDYKDLAKRYQYQQLWDGDPATNLQPVFMGLPKPMTPDDWSDKAFAAARVAQGLPVDDMPHDIGDDAISTKPPTPTPTPTPAPPVDGDWPLPTVLQRCEFTDQFGQTPIGEFGWNSRASQCPPDRVAYFEVPKGAHKVALTPNPQGNASEIEFCISTIPGNFDPSKPGLYLKAGGLQEPYTLPNDGVWPFHDDATVFASIRFTKQANSVLVSRGE